MDFSVLILGSGSALPTARRNPTSQLINYNGKLFLIDCAEGSQIQLRKNHVKLQKIGHIFISHLHGDHYLGLVGLLSTMHLLGRKKELTIFAPKELQNIVDVQLDASKTQLNFPITYVPHSGKTLKVVLDNPWMSVSIFPLKHRITCYGFLFNEKKKDDKLIKFKVKELSIPLELAASIKSGDGYTDEKNIFHSHQELTIPSSTPRSYAFCSDTKFFEELSNWVNEVDLLYHEATFNEEFSKRAKQTYHSTAKQAANVALNANVKKLIIGHFSARFTDVTPLLNEAVAVFPNTIVGEDNMVLTIPIRK